MTNSDRHTYLIVGNKKVDIWSDSCFGTEEACHLVRPSLRTIHHLAQIASFHEKNAKDKTKRIQLRVKNVQRLKFINTLYEQPPVVLPSIDMSER